MAQVTIATVTIPGWQGNTAGIQLRIYANQSFTAASGTIYPQTAVNNPASLGTFYQSFGCTAGGGELIIPAITLDSTTDSLDNPGATYTAVIFDSSAGLPVQQFGTFAAWSLAPTPTSTTWAEIMQAMVTQ